MIQKQHLQAPMAPTGTQAPTSAQAPVTPVAAQVAQKIQQLGEVKEQLIQNIKSNSNVLFNIGLFIYILFLLSLNYLFYNLLIKYAQYWHKEKIADMLEAKKEIDDYNKQQLLLAQQKAQNNTTQVILKEKTAPSVAQKNAPTNAPMNAPTNDPPKEKSKKHHKEKHHKGKHQKAQESNESPEPKKGKSKKHHKKH